MARSKATYSTTTREIVATVVAQATTNQLPHQQNVTIAKVEILPQPYLVQTLQVARFVQFPPSSLRFFLRLCNLKYYLVSNYSKVNLGLQSANELHITFTTPLGSITHKR